MSGAAAPRLLASLLALSLAVSCTQAEPTRATKLPSADVPNGEKLARDAGAILLQYAAYNYGLAGALSGERTRSVTPPRYAAVARDGARLIGKFSETALSATLDRSGPIRDKTIALADGLADVARDANAYADGGEPAAFARLTKNVTASWQRLQDLAVTLPKDPALETTIARGMSLVVTPKAERRSFLTAGPYTTAAEAQQALRAMGSPLNASVSASAPFVVRIGPYGDRAAADQLSAELARLRITSIVTDEDSYSFTRSGPVPDAELWREPSRVQDTHGASRRIALSADGSWILTGGDDAYAALFDPKGMLRALPQGYAGMSVLGFSDDATFFALGGQVVNVLASPSGQLVGSGMRFTSSATQLLFVPTTRLFVAAAKGPTGLDPGGAGVIGGRAPDGVPLGSPFPIPTPGGGAQLAASELGDVFVGTTSGGGYDIEGFRPGRDSALRTIARIPGVGTALAVDRGGTLAAAVTSGGTYQMRIGDSRNLAVARIDDPVRDIAFAPDGTLYLMGQTKITAFRAGSAVWSAPLVDGRRLVVGNRAVVLDGTDRLVAFAPADGATEELGAGGSILDVTISRDGRVVGAIVDARRAVLFTLP